MNEIPYKREHLEWRPITGHEGEFEVSNYGDFHILPFEFIDKANRKIKRKEKFYWSEELKEYGGSNNQNAYLGIHLSGMKKSYAHRIAAKEFCYNHDTNSKNQVNHIDGNHKNNYCGCKENNYTDSNLEWVTGKENAEHASKTGLINKISPKRKEACKKNREKIDYSIMRRPVLKIDIYTGQVLREYESVALASKILGLRSNSTIQAVASKKDKYHKTAKGFNWVYKDEYKPEYDYKVQIMQSKANKKPVIQKTLDGAFIKEYESISSACEELGISGNGYISACCRGNKTHYKGFIWEYKK